jgi:hypothetical protein
MTDKRRLSFDVYPEVFDDLRELQNKTQASNLLEVFRRSLAVYEMVVDCTNDGGKLILADKNGKQETIRLI